MAKGLDVRLARWLLLWQEALPRHKSTRRVWENQINAFVLAAQQDVAAQPLGWWQKLLLLYRFQQALAAEGVPGEALRPLIFAVLLRVFFNR